MNRSRKHPMRWLVPLSLLVVSLVSLFGVQASRSHAPLLRALVAATAPEPQQPIFQLDCSIPALTTEPVKADNVCGKTGSASASSRSGKQNVIKNRFCLPGSQTTPVEISFDTIDSLQQAARDKDIPFGRIKLANGKTKENLPPNRSVLTDLFTTSQGDHLGEGKLVTLEGFVFKAQHSNTFVVGSDTGESVNCNTISLLGNDIHIAISKTKADAAAAVTGTTAQRKKAECRTITAEITPHHRSQIYDRFDTNPADFLQGAHQKTGQDKLEGSPLPLQGARVRITGQLFFDASHSPCRNGKGAPPRRSIWEIHPVFAISVFDPSQDQFVSLEEWVANHSQ